jgi:hypothetical protein
MHPDYIDAFLRLAYLANKRGDINRAFFWIHESTKSKAKAPVNQFCLKAKILGDLGETLESQKTFKYILEKVMKEDTYSFLGLANIAYKQALESPSEQ